jgi:hypothetical protein
MKKLVGAFLMLVLFAATVAADYGKYFSKAAPPTGLGPLKFDMTIVQAKKLCEYGWTEMKLNSAYYLSDPADVLFECPALPMDVGFGDYEINVGFIKNRLVTISLLKDLAGPGVLPRSPVSKPPFRHTHGALVRKYGDAPANQSDRDAAHLSYTWSFRSGNPKDAYEVMVARYTLDKVTNLHLRYRSQRYRIAYDKLQRQMEKRSLERTEGAF